jgi:hypothetical protein
MAHTYQDLARMTVDGLREVAKGIEHEAVRGYTQLNKEHLLPAICRALGIETQAHHHVVWIDKQAMKAEIRALRSSRDAMLSASGDRSSLSATLRRIHALKRRLRRAMV